VTSGDVGRVLALQCGMLSNEKKKIIQPRDETPLPGVRQPLAATRLPDDLLSEHIQRVAIAGAVGAGLWLFGLVMDAIVMPLTLGTRPPALMITTDILGVLVSAALFAFIRHSSYAPQLKADVGLMFMVLNALAVAPCSPCTVNAAVSTSNQPSLVTRPVG